MSNQYLADVVMPPPTEEPCEIEETPQDIPEGEPIPMAEQRSATAEEVSYEDEEDEDSLVPEPVKKEKIPQDEIFTPPKVKTILDPESLKEDPAPQSAVKKPKQTRKKRGPATPEQLERLARGRAKAAETRARKKKEKEERLAKEKADKDLVEAVREKERKKLRKKLEEPIDEPSPVPSVKFVEKPVVVEKGYSQKDLDEAVARAVEQSVAKVETLRKNRKAEKQKAQAKAKHEAKVFKDINTALKNDVWAQCFL
jgi:hypothetical protein